jgi:hypothetical protein
MVAASQIIRPLAGYSGGQIICPLWAVIRLGGFHLKLRGSGWARQLPCLSTPDPLSPPHRCLPLPPLIDVSPATRLARFCQISLSL